jgi:hypothetical protein
MAGLSMRRDLVLMGTFAAIAGIGLAAALTAALGVRSSGPPAPLKAAAVAPPATATVAETPVASKAKVVHEKRHRSHRRNLRKAAPAAPSRTPVVAQAPVRIQAPVREQPQTVSAPAPAPRPAQPLSRPKTNGSGGGTPGVSFDDSG